MSYENFGNEGGFGIEVFQGDEMQGDEMQGVDLVSGQSDFGASVADLLGYSEFGAMSAPQQRQQQHPQHRPGFGFGGGGQQMLQRIEARFARMEKAVLSNAQATKHLIDMAKSGRSAPVRVEGRSGITVREDVPTKPRQLVIGITSPTIVAAAATQIITLQPQEIFRLDRLVVANSVASAFGISDVKVGKDSQFVAAGEVPSEVFSNLSVGVSLKGDTAKPGIIISVSVVNNSGAAAFFRGAIIGLSIID